MRRVVCSVATLALVAAFGSASAHAASGPATNVGKTVKPFTLTDSADKSFALASFKDKKAVVVVFLGTECPINNAYLPVLTALHNDYAGKGVQFLGINSNVHDTPTRIAAHVKANSIPFPVLRDPANVVADDFGARRTPEAFVLSPAGKVLYQGKIDDQFGIGYRRKEATRRDLAVALDEVLAGKAVSQSFTDVAGCLIARAIKTKETGTITWTKHVSRIVQDHCQECHRPGQVGPMPLRTYHDAVAWSEMIREVVEDRRMPPWHADPRYGHFANDRSLTKQERDTLLGWIKEGCAKGDTKDLPAPKNWPAGWTIGKPDLVVEMPREYTVPAEGGPKGIKYQIFAVPTNFAEDRWIVAAEARPGAREVVHHILVYIVDPTRKGKDKRRIGERTGMPQDGIGRGLLVAYAPGDLPLKLKPGYAKKLPRGALLVFQMHYTPDGVERKDRSSVGLVFAKEPPKYEVRTRAVTQQVFLIPPGAKNHRVRSNSTFNQDVELLSLFPHMHLRGKDFTYVAVAPGGKKETLLSVPRYDFGWQTSYSLKKPLRLPAGTRIDCTAHFDNSADNPNNPNPKKWVHWGEQTWEEMMIGFADYAVAVEQAKKEEKK
jgi:peroxiredoxin